MRTILTLRGPDQRGACQIAIDDGHKDFPDTIERWIGHAQHGVTLTVEQAGKAVRTYPRPMGKVIALRGAP